MKIFTRRPGASRNRALIERARAHRILDSAKKGDRPAQRLITWALRITGDIA